MFFDFVIYQKENNENDMTAYAICFDFCYQPQPSQTRQIRCQAPAVTRLLDFTY
jgi:hypothetical protein